MTNFGLLVEEKKKNYNSSTEFVDPKHPNTFFKGPDLPFDRIEQHCLARLSSHQVMLTGGTTGEIINNELQIIDYESAKTFVYDFLKNTWTSGPEMSFGRTGHGCTSFTDEEDINWTIVSGGLYSNDGVKLTEMLEENSSEWTEMEINHPLINFCFLINFIGKVILLESENNGDYSKSGTKMHELVKSANGQFEWILSDLSLKYQRTTPFIALDVPLSSVNSSLYLLKN